MKITLNKGQELAKQALLDFISNDNEQCFCLMGAAGCGKTTVLKQFEGDLAFFNQQRKMFHLPTFNSVIYTATTNKASTLFEEASTIHSLLGLRVDTCFNTGVQKVIPSGKTKEIVNSVVVIDEASMIDQDLLNIILKLTTQSKVIFLLDGCQLAPIGCDKPVVNNQGFPEAVLTEPMRQGVDTHLYQVCDLMRCGVNIHEYIEPVQGEGVRFVDGETFKNEIIESFKNEEDCRVLAYRNEHVENLNKFIRKNVRNTTEFCIGDLVVARNSCTDLHGLTGATKVEFTYKIQDINSDVSNYFGVDCFRVRVDNSWFRTPVNKTAYFNKMKTLKNEAKQNPKLWRTYFSLKENILDIRDASACTVHSSQGSTYQKVFIDLNDICLAANRDKEMFLRMIYVAISRAKQEVIIYGL